MDGTKECRTLSCSNYCFLLNHEILLESHDYFLFTCLCDSYQYFGYVLRTIVYSVFKVLPKLFIQSFRYTPPRRSSRSERRRVYAMKPSRERATAFQRRSDGRNSIVIRHLKSRQVRGVCRKEKRGRAERPQR